MIFELEMKVIIGNSKCILIVDGYLSYFNMWFIDYCDRYNILFIILFLYFIY